MNNTFGKIIGPCDCDLAGGQCSKCGIEDHEVPIMGLSRDMITCTRGNLNKWSCLFGSRRDVFLIIHETCFHTAKIAGLDLDVWTLQTGAQKNLTFEILKLTLTLV